MNPVATRDALRELNLAYLTFIQRTLNVSTPSERTGLTLSPQGAQFLQALTPAQRERMAGCGLALGCFRFDDRLLVALLSGHLDSVAPDRGAPGKVRRETELLAA